MHADAAMASPVEDSLTTDVRSLDLGLPDTTAARVALESPRLALAGSYTTRPAVAGEAHFGGFVARTGWPF